MRGPDANVSQLDTAKQQRTPFDVLDVPLDDGSKSIGLPFLETSPFF